MPARDATERAGPSPLPAVLLWAGIGLVPISAFLLLTGADTGSLRAAMLLVLPVVLLIGGSVGLRGRDGNVRRSMRRALFEEIDQLRGDLRTEIGSAIRLTHRSHSDQLQVLQENLAMLRGQLDAVRAELARVTSTAAEPRQDPPATGYRGYGTATVPGTTRNEPPEDAPVTGASGWAERTPAGWTPTGQDWSEAGRQQPGRYGESRHPTDRPAGDPYVTGRHGDGYQAGDPGPVDGSPAGVHIPGGVLRHTETVRVTTRQTIVSPSGPDPTQTGTHPSLSGYQVSGGYGQPVRRGVAHPTGSTYQSGTYQIHTGTYPVHPPDASDGGTDQPAIGRRSAEPAVHHWAPPAPGHRAHPATAHPAARQDADWQPATDHRVMRQDADRWALHSQSAWAVAGSRAGEQMSEPVAQERWRAAYRPDADERRSDLHTGDRWASVHADERGQEIRMGQRRASVHADEAGTRIQVEDRWAALRQEEPAATSWSELMPSWAEPGRSEAEPDQVRHRYAPGPADRAAPGGRARMPASERFDRGRR